MAVLDKKLLLSEIESKMNGYIPADTVRRKREEHRERLQKICLHVKGDD